MASDPLFVNERLPEDIEQNAKGGPGFKTTVLELSGGQEHRNAEWSRQRLTWDIGYGVGSKEDAERILSMFYVCMARAHGFRFKDWMDYEIGSSDEPQVIGTGNGSKTDFQATRIYTVGSYSFVRKITRLVVGTIHVFDNGTEKTETTDYTVDYDTGVISFVSAPANGHYISIYGEFDVPVRFDMDELSIEMIWEKAADIPQIIVKELKE